MPEDKYDLVDAIIRWEGGEMTGKEELEFFCYMKNSGLIKGMQGSYQRYFEALVMEKLVVERDGTWEIVPQSSTEEGPE